MPEVEKVISNANATRFQYGTTSTISGETVFYGAVIYGTDLTFDEETGLPTGGTVERIELQTIGEDGPKTVHGVYADIDADAHQLNNAFMGDSAPWYDPLQFFSSDLLQTSYMSNWTGGAAAEVFFGGNKADTLSGDLGDDTLYGGAGEDLLKGDAGNDTLFGGDGKDELFGGAGKDNINGGNDDDMIYSGEGDDNLTGNDGDDVLIGDAGKDQMTGGDGDDQAQGNDGTDTFVADLTSEGGNMTIRDFTSGEDSLYLQTGDVLSAEDLYAIFTNGASEVGDKVVFDNGDGNLLTLLNTNLDDIDINSFYDANIEGDFLLGML